MIRRNTAIVFGLFVLLLAGTLIWQNSQTSEENADLTPTAPEDLLFNLDEAEIQSIVLQAADNQRVNLERSEDDEWVLIYPHAEATDVTTVSTAVSQLLNVRITSRPQSIPDLQTVGLDPAAHTILIQTKDGKQWLVNVGNQTPTEGGYYVLTEDRIIYVANKFGLDSLIKFLENPPILNTPTPFPSATSEIEETPGALTPGPEATSTP